MMIRIRANEDDIFYGTQGMLLKEEITDQLSINKGLLHRFAAVDLAPNDQLETGFSAVDRDRHLVRMDKLYRNEDILTVIESLGPTASTLVVIDMPKNLSLPGKWRQEQMKMHPFRTTLNSGETLSRFEPRGLSLYEELEEAGATPFLYFNYWTRIHYDMLIPFRSRSPHGCRALQTAIEHQLGLKNLPTNLAPSSVLESMVGAYASWAFWAGQPTVDYQVYQDAEGHRILIPKARPHLTMPPKQKRWFRRRMGRITIAAEVRKSQSEFTPADDL